VNRLDPVLPNPHSPSQFIPRTHRLLFVVPLRSVVIATTLSRWLSDHRIFFFFLFWYRRSTPPPCRCPTFPVGTTLSCRPWLLGGGLLVFPGALASCWCNVTATAVFWLFLWLFFFCLVFLVSTSQYTTPRWNTQTLVRFWFGQSPCSLAACE
jgi:hypothetical protein